MKHFAKALREQYLTAMGVGCTTQPATQIRKLWVNSFVYGAIPIAISMAKDLPPGLVRELKVITDTMLTEVDGIAPPQTEKQHPQFRQAARAALCELQRELQLLL
jgi:hypothetical protein